MASRNGRTVGKAYGSINVKMKTEDAKEADATAGVEGTTETTPLVDAAQLRTTTEAAELHGRTRMLGYEAASPLSKLLFGWFAPLLELGNAKEQLDPEDLSLLPLPQDCTTEPVVQQFRQDWQKELDRVEKEEEKRAALFAAQEEEARKKKGKRRRRLTKKELKPPQPSLAKALWQSFGREFAIAGLLKFVHDCSLFVGPQVLNGLIQFLRDKDASLWRGFELTMWVVGSQLAMTFCLRHYFFKCFLTGLRVRTAVTTVVYQKSLVLAPIERQARFSQGEIVNLISIDAQRLQDITANLHAVWYSFLQIGLSVYFLWQQLGPSILAGVAIIVIMMPITSNIAGWMGGMQRKLMKVRDERVDVNNEVLRSMKVIKLQAWEESFQQRLQDLRQLELKQLFRYVVGSSFTIVMFGAVPLLVAVATFAAYVLSGHALDVANALTALALFEILRFPLFMLPRVITSVIEAGISFQRIRTFLLAQEQNPVDDGDLTGDGDVRIRDGTFIYETKKPRKAMEEEEENPPGSRGRKNKKKKSKKKSKGADDEQTLDKKVIEANWEVTLLRSRLHDTERRIRAMLENGQDEKRKDKQEEDPLVVVGEDVVVQEAHANGVDDSQPSDLLALRHIDFESHRGELVAIVGAVGSGKSTFLSALLGEMRGLSGTVNLKGKLAYVPQTPFIMNDTVKNNILFSHAHDEDDYDEALYRRAIHCCALEHDLEMLADGDATEIGERGITMSGGQKARVSMARAVYHDANIYLLDDPLAAVDAHVGKFMFQKCIVDQLLLGGTHETTEMTTIAEKNTVLLVTNAIQYLNHPSVSRIICLQDGVIAEQGTYAELAGDPDSMFAASLAVLEESGGGALTDAGEPEAGTTTTTPTGEASSTAATSETAPSEGDADNKQDSTSVAPKKEAPFESDKKMVAPDKAPKSGALTTDEYKERSVGSVAFSVYLSWAKAAGGVGVAIAIVIVYSIVEAVNVGAKWWLTFWSEHAGAGSSSQLYYLGIYTAITFSAVFATFFRLLLVTTAGLRASRVLFTRMLDTIMMVPMSFFDTTPVGRIINRFSKDMNAVDERVVGALRSYLATVTTIIGVMVTISAVTPYFLLCLAPVLGVYIHQQIYFSRTYREVKRLDSVSRSPIYALLGETLDGVSTIRAFQAEHGLERRMSAMLNKQQSAYFLTVAAQSWLAIRLELVGTAVIAFACLCAVLEHPFKAGSETFAGLAGLSISLSLSVTQSLNFSVRMASDLEATMVAAERIEQYCALTREAPREVDRDKMVPPNWPATGEIEFRNVKLRYRPELPLVLKGLNLSIPGRSKVGVVGRTGAGKSTLMVGLMRIVEVDSGSVLIDGVDVATIGLRLLRSSIAVIPQDPLLFSGTVRTNLDPFDSHSDDELFTVLKRVGLWAKPSDSHQSVSSLGRSAVKDLADDVLEGGSNFSVGQRQLLVIARALLLGARIVIMDEATASVDAETDARIQNVMRSEFRDATTITVAHRLNTIMDSDYILVMDDGRAAEFDTPTALLRAGGMFKSLVDAAEDINSTVE